ncbi:hypothetical protein NZA98_06600, partial [Escherichia coli]|nr:hypothetical protein [Escherichia coli]
TSGGRIKRKQFHGQSRKQESASKQVVFGAARINLVKIARGFSVLLLIAASIANTESCPLSASRKVNGE